MLNYVVVEKNAVRNGSFALNKRNLIILYTENGGIRLVLNVRACHRKTHLSIRVHQKRGQLACYEMLAFAVDKKK